MWSAWNMLLTESSTTVMVSAMICFSSSVSWTMGGQDAVDAAGDGHEIAHGAACRAPAGDFFICSITDGLLL